MHKPLPVNRLEIIAACNAVLADTFSHHIVEAQQIGREYQQLLLKIERLVSRGGKRLRPLLTVWGYQAFGGTQPAILSVAASQELLHAFILMHDDVIDRDMVRWGGPNISGTYHRTLSKNMSVADTQHYAASMAILAGDACHSLAHELLLSANFPADMLRQAAHLMNTTELAMIGGETLDVLLPLKKTYPSIRQILQVYRHKTALYTFITPLKIGALLAGATAAELKLIEDFAQPLGIAYQLQDDDLGIFGNTAKTGKPVTSDLTEGKRTVLMAYGLQLATDSDRQFLENTLGKPSISRQDHQKIKQILTTSTARAQASKLMHIYVKSSQTALAALPIETSIKSELQQLVHSLLERRQ